MGERPGPARSLPYWWEEWAGRLEAEVERFDALGLPLDVIEDPRKGHQRLILESAIEIDGDTIRVKVVYPDGYPHRRFQIFAPERRLGRHQAPNGDLCVLARGARYWSPDILAADFVAEQVPRVFELVRAGGEALRNAEDPQGEPITTYYGGLPTGGVIVDDHAHSIDFEAHQSGATRYLINADPRWMVKPAEGSGPMVLGQAFLVGILGQAGEALTDCIREPLADRFSKEPQEGRWVYLSNPPLIDDADELWRVAEQRDPAITRWVRSSEGVKMLGVCVREEIGQGVYAPTWVFLSRDVFTTLPPRRNARSGNPATRAATGALMVGPTAVLRGLRWTSEALRSRIPELAPLRSRTVSVVGAGSLGAPIVQELVKARVGTIRLIDGDHVDAGTSVRYPLGLADAGLPKVMALHRWAHSHDPGVAIEPTQLQIGTASQTYVNEREQLAQFLESSDLLVNATAEMDIARQLDRAALHLGVPRLHLWSVSGYGGIVALLRDGETGCFHCLELAISDASAAGTPMVGVPARENWIQAPGCADQTFAATHIDLMPVATQAASVAFSELTRGEAESQAFEDDVFAVQTRSPSGAPLAPSWSSFKLPPDSRCPACSG